jgi:hypothetical protein
VFEVQSNSDGVPILEVGWGSPHEVESNTVNAALPAHADRWPEIARRLVLLK